MSFCRITGRARALPKPNFFPIIPPISPADARRLCRITAKRMDRHNFVPVIEMGKRPANSGGNKDKNGVHSNRNDFKYVRPILDTDKVEREDKAFTELCRVLDKIRKELKANGGEDKSFVYLSTSVLCGLVVPAEVEEAIKRGELEAVSLAKNCEKAMFKLKGKPTVFVPLMEVPMDDPQGHDFRLYDGKGQSKETLNKQKQYLDGKKKKTLANKKIFENLEKQADEEMLKDMEKIEPSEKWKNANVNKKRSKADQKWKTKTKNFRKTFAVESNMSAYGRNWKNGLKLNLHKMDWNMIGQIPANDLDKTIPKRAKIKTIDEKALMEKKRIKNVYVPDQPGLELVPYMGDVPIESCRVPGGLAEFVEKSKGQDYNTNASLKSMFACEETLKILPTLCEFEEFGKYLTLEPDKCHVKLGCVYDHGDGVKFIDNPGKKMYSMRLVV